MELSVTTDVSTPMRDGVILKADVYRPADGGRHPTVLFRTPYDKRTSVTAAEIAQYVGAGYAIVAQDTRGRFASQGVFRPFVDERADGEDTLRWIAAQNFSDGTVAMAGSSYVGATQWLAAAGDSPALRAIAPNTTGSSYHEGWTYQGGAFHLGFVLSWTLDNLALAAAATDVTNGCRPAWHLDDAMAAVDDIAARYRTTPLTAAAPPHGLAPFYDDWISRAADDDTWRSTAPRERYEQVDAPSLNIGGWYDCFLGGTLENYIGMRARGGSAAAQSSRLLIGPWSHGLATGQFPWLSYGVRANADVLNLTTERIRFFDHHVRGIDNGLADEPPVRIFVMGIDKWRSELDWPLPDTRYEPYFLHSAGDADSTGGSLSPALPGDEPADSYLYDPSDPAPTVGGQTFLPGFKVGANGGPRDRREVEARSDVLVYSTSPLEADVEVTGPISLVLHVSSSAPDTDFTAALIDVRPDGQAIVLTEGMMRLRYRRSSQRPELLPPGDVAELTIDMWATSNVFRAGHRIRLDVTSSSFPRFDRNTNTGGDIWRETEADFVVARNTVHHDAGRPSHIVLPIIDRSS